ncbi:MAG: TRAP transporter small permease [Acidimicrobiia bacterium]
MSPPNGLEPDHENPADEYQSLANMEHPELLPAREPMRRIFHGIGVIEQALGSLLLLVILFLVLTQVAQRYIPGRWLWSGEVARYALVWGTFLMAGYLMANHPYHIAIHVVDNVVGERTLAVIKFLVNMVILLTTVALLYGNIDLVVNDIGQVTPAAQMPLRIVNMVPLTGLVLIVLRVVLGIVVEDVPALVRRKEKTT